MIVWTKLIHPNSFRLKIKILAISLKNKLLVFFYR
ncbi:hypothetical protein FA947_02375 [Mycoplasmoides pneumoniae]|nr:hypothetical protein FA919_02375 [Mycoplasmoides pneumoniae]QHR04666.1 hypothetical protein FA920_02375 [Mycoplasmoides pneumoniae]QHR05370.1 hypothetical protein FA921_02380 [Mycoplasmoides pneumoniae]QHR06075.1 hypothetical protein FA922_02375 [Mycoplasmoides pneumoniae]QHR06777.1 hypothetical protein FA923_02375 [Mycoplasmoides pneumoniae]